MSLVLEQLYRDHRNMRELLDVIETLLGSHADRPSPDIELLRDVMEYTLNYPDLVHHPKEDLIYNRIIARDPSARDEIGDLVADHAALSAKARGVADALRFIWRDGELSRDWLEKLIRGFVDATRRHMESEEQIVFPLALRKLDDADWLSIDLAASGPENLSLGKKSEERYLALHDRIMRLAA